MNGRIYDPLLGRFLSADKKVDGVYTLQGYNRYSYVHNNPLAYTDPSGYSHAYVIGALDRPRRYAQWQQEGVLERNLELQKAEDTGTLIGSAIVVVAVTVYMAPWVAVEGSVVADQLADDASPPDTPGERDLEESAPQPEELDEIDPQQPADSEEERYQRYWEQDYRDPDNNTRQRDQAPPGTRSITDQKKSRDSDEVYERETIYDEYGRRIGNNDHTDHGRGDHENPHHHENAPIGPGNQGEHGPPLPGLHPQTPPRETPPPPPPPPPPPEEDQ